ncbi:hypothetical protein Taro_027529, partial [Colocasia esculenta]|nr:hypothetical protein [Colocasia esculenta]
VKISKNEEETPRTPSPHEILSSLASSPRPTTFGNELGSAKRPTTIRVNRQPSRIRQTVCPKIRNFHFRRFEPSGADRTAHVAWLTPPFRAPLSRSAILLFPQHGSPQSSPFLSSPLQPASGSRHRPRLPLLRGEGAVATAVLRPGTFLRSLLRPALL